MKRVFVLSREELNRLFVVLDDLMEEGMQIFLLCGDLASGKTTLMQEYIQYRLTLDSHNSSFHTRDLENISSPTFSLCQSYGQYHHYDLYFHGVEKFLELGFLEVLCEGVHFIEWGGPLEGILFKSGYNYVIIHIEYDFLNGQEARRYEIEAKGRDE